MSMMRLTQLPAELQIEIFSYLDNTDLKAVRQVCRQGRDNATPELFRSVVACVRYKGMRAFENVSKDDVLRKSVREIVVDGSTYSDYLASSKQSYTDAAIQDACGREKEPQDWVMRARWRRYKALHEEECDMIDGLVLLHTVAKGVQWMPSLCRIVFSRGPHPVTLEKKGLRDIIPPSFRGRYHGLHHIIGAIHCEKITTIREFVILPSSPHMFSLDAFAFQNPDDLEAGKFFFQHLHKLHLNVNIRDNGGDTQVLLTNMTHLLSQAKDLRELSLHLSPFKNSEGYMDMFLSIPDGNAIFPHLGLHNTWSHLRSLSVAGIYPTEIDLMDLIDRHRSTLTSLKFTECGLKEGKWAHIVDEVVFMTSVVTFALECVHEVHITDEKLFEDLWNSRSESIRDWQFNGELMMDDEGKRYFKELQVVGKQAYAWTHTENG